MDQDKFIADAKGKRKKNINEITLKVLAKMLNDNVKYLDTHYIQDRSLEVIEKTLRKLKFKSDEVQRVRRAFLDVLLDGAKKELYGYEDEYKAAKNDLKDKSKKEKAKETLGRIERIRNKTPNGLSEQRDMECEPVCQLIAVELLSKDLMLKDEDFVNGCIEIDNELLMSTIYRSLFEELFEQLVTSLDKSYILANAVNWGVPRHEIRLKMIDNRLKNEKDNGGNPECNRDDTYKGNEQADKS